MYGVRRPRGALLVTAFVIILLQSACTPAAPSVRTEGVAALPTAAVATATATATSTATSTPPSTATLTPDVTPTQMPVLAPPAKGAANVAGLILWDGQPVAHGAIWLCKGWTFYGGCLDYKSNTDANGYYAFHNVAPGSYLVAINSFGSTWFIFYHDAKGNAKQDVAADQTLVLAAWNIWKLDAGTHGVGGLPHVLPDLSLHFFQLVQCGFAHQAIGQGLDLPGGLLEQPPSIGGHDLP